MKRAQLRNRLLVLAGVALLSAGAAAQGSRPIDVHKARVIDLWTPERRAAAIPRDLFVDQRGLGYLRHPGGHLQPYGHDTPARTAAPEPVPSPFAKGGGGATGSKGGGGGGSGDSTPPTISDMNPGSGQVIGATHAFSAIVTDESGVQSVTFRVGKSGTSMQSFVASRGSDGKTWSATLQGFTAGAWTWEVVARDATKRGGNTGASDPVAFSVGTATGGGDCANCEWTGGAVQTAAGRIYFYMGSTGYVCSGTVVTDGTTGRSVILTAAHCVYDDVAKEFAHDVMFIPNQAGTSGTRTDRNCSNDPIGCWVPDHGVVDLNWANRRFPDNIAWDYAFYVVPDSGAHQGAGSSNEALDLAAGSLALSFAAPAHDVSGSADFTHALGYSYSEDPKFMFCAGDMSTQGAVNWWLSGCGLSGGASGGPWVQPMDIGTGTGPIISVNSWGYIDPSGRPLPGMAGPKLSGTSAQCVFGAARSGTAAQPGGTVVTCPP